MKQVFDKRKSTPSASCPWHVTSEQKFEPKGSKHSNNLKISTRFSPVSRNSKETAYSPIYSPSTAPTFDRGNSALSTDRLLAFEEGGRSSIKKSFDSTVYKTQETYQSQVAYMQQYISYLKSKLQDYEGTSINAEFNSDLQEEIKYLKEIIQNKNEEANNYLDELCEKQDQIFKLTERLSDLQESSQESYKKSLRKNDEIELIENELKRFYSKRFNEYEYIVSELKKEIEERNKEILKLTKKKTEENSDFQKIKEKVFEKIAKNEDTFKDLQIHVQKTEEKLFALSATLRVFQGSLLLSPGNKLKKLEEEITGRYEKVLTEQKEETEKIKENLKIKIEELEKLENSQKKTEKLLESQEEALRTEKQLNQDYIKQKNELEIQLNKALERLENEKLENHSNSQKILELSNTLIKTEQAIQDLTSESHLLKEKLSQSLKQGSFKDKEISQKIAEISNLKSAILEKKIRSQEKKTTLTEKEKKIEQIQNSHNSIQGTLKDLSQEIKLKQIEIENLQFRELEKVQKISYLDKSLQDQLMIIEGLNEKVRDLQLNILAETREGQKLLQKNLDQGKLIESLNAEKQNFKVLLEKKEANLQEIVSKNSGNLMEIERYKSKLEKAKNSLHKLEEQLKIQTKNFESISESKKMTDEELIESKTQVKLLELNKSDSFKILNEFQSKITDFSKYIQDQELTIEHLRASIIKMNEEHESKIVSLSQAKFAELKEAKLNFEKEKNTQLQKIQSLENFCLELNKENSEKHEKILDLVAEFKNFKEKALENEINMSKTQSLLVEKVNYFKETEIKLREELNKVSLMNDDLAEHLRICEREIVKLKEEKNEVLFMLNEKENSFIVSARKNEELVDQFEYIIENNSKSIAELQLSKTKLIEKCNFNVQESEIHEKELLSHIEKLQLNINNLQETISKKNIEIQTKEQSFANSEFEFKSEIQNFSIKIKENEIEISKLNESLSQKTLLEKSLKSEISELKNKAFEKERTIQKASSDIEILKDQLAGKEKNEVVLKGKIKISEENFEKSKEVNENLQDNLDKTKRALDKSIEDSLGKVEKLTIELQKTENKLSDSESNVQNFKDKIEKLTDEVLIEKRRKNELEINYREKVSDLERESKNLEAKIQNLNIKNLEAIKDNTELKDNLAILDSKIINISQDLEKSQESLATALEREKSNEENLKNTIFEYEQNIENLKLTNQQKLIVLQTEISKLESEIKEKDQKIKTLKLEIKTLHENEVNLKTEALQFKLKIEKEEKVNKILSDTKVKELETLEKQVFEVREQFLSASEKRASEEITNSSLREINRENEINIKNLLEKIQLSEGIIRNIKTQNSELESVINVLHSDLNSEKELKKQTEQALQQKKKDVKMLVDNLDEIKKVFDTDLFNLESKLSDEKQKNQKFERELIKKHEELERSLIELDSLRLKITQSQDDLEKLNLILNQEKSKTLETEKTFKNEIRILNKEKNELILLFENVSNELEIITKKSEVFKSEKEDSKKNLEQSRREKKHLEETLEKTKKNNENLLGKVKKHKESSSRLKQETECLTSQLKKQEKLIQKKETENLSLQSLIELKESKLNSQNSLIIQLKSDLNLLEQKTLSLEVIADQQFSYKQKIHSLQAHLSNLDSINLDLNKEHSLEVKEKQELIENLTQTLNKTQKEKDILSHSLKNLESQLDFHQKTQKNSEVRNENLITQLRCELESKSLSAETAGQKLNSISRKYQDFLDEFPEADHEKLRKLYKGFKNAGREMVEPDVLENEIRKLRNLLDCAKAELAYMKHENSQIREKLATSGLEASRIDDLRIRELKLAEDEIRRTKLELSETKLEQEKLVYQKQELEKNTRDLEGKLRTSMNSTNSLKEKLDTLNDSFRQMTTEKDKLIIQITGENSELKEKLSKAKENYSNDKASLTKALNENLEKRSNLDQNLEELKNEAKTLAKELKDKTSDYDSLLINYNTSKQTSKSKKNSLKTALSLTKDSLISLQDIHQNLNKKHEVLTEELEFLRSSQSDQQLLINQLLKEKSDLESFLSELKNILEESGAFDIHQLRELVIQLQTQKILDSRNLIKNSETIKKLEEVNMQKMNTYKINILQYELDQKQKKMEEMKDEYFSSLTVYTQALNRQDRGLSEIESTLSSSLSKKIDQDEISELLKNLLKVVSSIKNN